MGLTERDLATLYLVRCHIFKHKPCKRKECKERVCMCCNKVPKDHKNCQHHKAAEQVSQSRFFISWFCFVLMTTITFPSIVYLTVRTYLDNIVSQSKITV